MLKPLQQFHCDTCRNLIESLNDGLVEWDLTKDETNWKPLRNNFKIVHKDKYPTEKDNCYGSEKQNLPLGQFMGSKGLILLLFLISEGPTGSDAPVLKRMEDVSSWVSLVRRTQIPYYEEAYGFFGDHEGYLSAMSHVEKYSEASLKAIIEEFWKE